MKWFYQTTRVEHWLKRRSGDRAERLPSEDVEVDVIDGLPGIRAVVEDESIPGFVEAELGGDLLCGEDHAADEGGVAVLEGGWAGGRLASGDEDDVGWGGGGDIAEGDEFGVLVDTIAGDVVAEDAGEDVVWVVGGHGQLPRAGRF